MSEKEGKKDWLGDIFITSFLSSLGLIFLGGILGVQLIMGLGVLALAPFFIIMVGAIFFRICDLFIELWQILRGKR